jgi:hypothetical protein
LKVEPEEIPDAEHELVNERVCAIDVAEASGKVCVRTPGGRELGIEKVTVESTADYWRIWYYARSRRAGRAAGQRPRREERPGPAQDRPGRRVAGQAHRERIVAAGVRPARADPAAATRRGPPICRPSSPPAGAATAYGSSRSSPRPESASRKSILKTIPMALQSSLRSTTAISPYQQFSSAMDLR